jgi:hypothetical protein
MWSFCREIRIYYRQAGRGDSSTAAAPTVIVADPLAPFAPGQGTLGIAAELILPGVPGAPLPPPLSAVAAAAGPPGAGGRAGPLPPAPAALTLDELRPLLRAALKIPTQRSRQATTARRREKSSLILNIYQLGPALGAIAPGAPGGAAESY